MTDPKEASFDNSDLATRKGWTTDCWNGYHLTCCGFLPELVGGAKPRRCRCPHHHHLEQPENHPDEPPLHQACFTFPPPDD